jgi:transglutaminase-like putative cysteine protease
MSENLDVEGNSATQCWFNVPTCALTITVNSAVETRRTNPFDFLLEAAAMELPVDYRPEICAALVPYRTASQANGPVADLAERILAETNRRTVPFLSALAKWMSEQFETTIRLTGDPYPAATTLAEGSGSCRDLAVLFMEVCRSAGLAARFVSGYQAVLEDDGERHLHAWAEVFLPGAGWRGFDPAQGLAVADGHVAVASGLVPQAAAATVGTFRGTDVSSTIDAQVVIRVS